MYDIPKHKAEEDEFYEAVENIVTSYQSERISAERAMSAIAAVIADTESGVDV